MKRAEGMLRKIERSGLLPNASTLVSHIVSLKPGISKNTWQQYKAAVLYYLQARQPTGWHQSIARLEAETASECKKTSMKTSGRRMKQVSDEKFDAVIAEVRASKNKYASFLVIWLVLGRQFGLRPHEWGESAVVTTGPEGEPGVFLRVANSKVSNGRANGLERHISLDGCDAKTVEAVTKFCRQMTRLRIAGLYPDVHLSCRRTLATINRRLFGESSKWIHLYSARHRFSSEAKAVFTREEVAALLGHATDKTATLHYGKKRSARGGLKVRPVAKEVGTVKRVYKPAVFANTPKPSPEA